MRKDILESVQLHLMKNIKPNYSTLAKQFDCDYRTVKRYFEKGKAHGILEMAKRQTAPSLLKGFEATIQDKIEIGCSSQAIFYFIHKFGYKGSYDTVNRYVKSFKSKKLKKATVRIETSPGLSAQVDWKENLKLLSRNGEMFNVNIFLYVLGYSRMKYIQLTVDRTQETLFDCLNHAFDRLGGIPEEIWFDNMKTVVDHSKSQFGKAVFNESFRQYAKDAGFQPISCRPFRPQTKGKVEALARTMDRLKVFNKEFEDLTELQQIIKVFMDDLNHQEISQATGVIPEQRFREEQLNLKGFDGALLENYSNPSETLKRKVSKESMILFGGKKYSVPVRYIGHTVTLKKVQEQLEIYTEGKQISVHRLSEHPYNYRREDYSEILKSDVLSHFDEAELEAYVDENLQAYDLL